MSFRLFYIPATGRVTLCTTNPDQPLPPGEAEISVPEMVRPSRVKVDLNTMEVVPADPPVVPLATLKDSAMWEVDQQAEAARLRFITSGAGQSLEYQSTEAEARAYLADPSPNLNNYPFLKAEVDAVADATNGPPPAASAVAAEVVTQANAWKVAGAQIKRLRRAAKLRIGAAVNANQIQNATQISWPTP